MTDLLSICYTYIEKKIHWRLCRGNSGVTCIGGGTVAAAMSAAGGRGVPVHGE
jgi:hypothetical protein